MAHDTTRRELAGVVRSLHVLLLSELSLLCCLPRPIPNSECSPRIFPQHSCTALYPRRPYFATICSPSHILQAQHVLHPISCNNMFPISSGCLSFSEEGCIYFRFAWQVGFIQRHTGKHPIIALPPLGVLVCINNWKTHTPRFCRNFLPRAGWRRHPHQTNVTEPTTSTFTTTFKTRQKKKSPYIRTPPFPLTPSGPHSRFGDK